MGYYQDIIFPKLMYWNIGKKSIRRRRAAMLKYAYGEILEIGIGEGTRYHNRRTKVTFKTI